MKVKTLRLSPGKLQSVHLHRSDSISRSFTQQENGTECAVQMFTVIKTLKPLRVERQVPDSKTCVFLNFDVISQTLVNAANYITCMMAGSDTYKKNLIKHLKLFLHNFSLSGRLNASWSCGEVEFLLGKLVM